MGFIAFFQVGEEGYTYVNVEDISTVSHVGPGQVCLFLRSTRSQYLVSARTTDSVVRAAQDAASSSCTVRIPPGPPKVADAV